MRIGAFCTLILHIYYGVGYCVVYFRLGLTTTFKKINESQLHTFFVYTHLGARWQFMRTMFYTVILENDLATKTLDDVKRLIASIPRKKLKDLRYYDLYQPGDSCLGLYFIESPDRKMLYIGKATSRTVCERVAAHFDSRAAAILNSLPKKVFQKTYGPIDPSDVDLHNIISGLKDWTIAVLFVEVNNEIRTQKLISKTESMLIFDLQPCNGGNCINGTNRKNPISTTTLIGQLILIP